MSGFRIDASSQVKPEALAAFISASLEPDLQTVPGIGPKTSALLAKGDDPITTTYQLVGQFLRLRADGMDTQAHCDAFYAWLKSRGVNSFRAGITKAIAEKVNTYIPGIYSEAELAQGGAAAEEEE